MSFRMEDVEDQEKTADVLDAASNLSYAKNKEQVDAVRLLSQPERIADGKGGWVVQELDEESGTYPIPECVDCDDPIPLPRLQLGRIRCVCCQQIKEVKRGR